jgi:hypothetical protein
MGQIRRSVCFGSRRRDSDHLPYLLIYSFLIWHFCICVLYISFETRRMQDIMKLQEILDRIILSISVSAQVAHHNKKYSTGYSLKE